MRECGGSRNQPRAGECSIIFRGRTSLTSERNGSPIALDATYSVGRSLSGVGIYSHELVHALARLHPEQRFRWCYRPHRFLRSFRQSVPANCSRHLLFEQSGIRSVLFHGLNQRLPAWRPKRAVVTFHDLFVMTGDYSTAEFRARFAQQAKEAAQRADLIVCVSAFTASQVEALLGVERARLRVVWHGAHVPADAPPDRDRENLVLHVGAIQRRKNVARLIDAFEALDHSWRLLLAGSAGFGAEEILTRIAASPAKARIEVAGYVTEETLRSAYRRARILAFPSLDEGFGIPVLEAMAHGLPVLTSNGSALAEVAGDAAVLVNPMEVEELRAALVRLATDTSVREALAREGRKRVQSHTWEAAARQTWKAYQELGV